jgi:3-hydroxyacyl-CoA dehydrogenase
MAIKIKIVEINNITIVGSGAMGSGIAYVSAVSGYNITITDKEQKFIDSGMDKIRKMLMDGIDKKKMSAAEGEKIFHRIKVQVDLKEAVKDADLVIEAVFEDMGVKKEIFSQLSQFTSQNTILASNTSTLSISEIAEAVEVNPSRVIGLHFFNPPAAMKLVEVIYGKDHSKDILDIGVNYVKSINKTPILAKDSPGFIVNRVLVPVLNEAVKLLDEGVAEKEDIDKALMLGANFPVGPLTLADYVGLDVALASIRTLESKFGEAYAPSPSIVRLVEEGKLGFKTGEGFYNYKK